MLRAGFALARCRLALDKLCTRSKACATGAELVSSVQVRLAVGDANDVQGPRRTRAASRIPSLVHGNLDKAIKGHVIGAQLLGRQKPCVKLASEGSTVLMEMTG